jgi:hypothetical protein
MMIHKCRSCGWPMEYAEFMAGSPAKCEECGQMQRLGGPPENDVTSGPPAVTKQSPSKFPLVAWVIGLGSFLACVGLCSDFGGVFSSSPEKLDPRVIESVEKDFDLDCAIAYVKRLDEVGVGHLITYTNVGRTVIGFGTSQQWSRMSKAEKVKALTVFAQAAIDTCPSRFDAKIRMMGLDANGNFSFTYDSPTQIWVND